METIQLFKIIGVGLLTLVCYVVIKPIKPDIAIFVSLAGSCIILIFCVDALSGVVGAISGIFEKTGLSGSLFSTILKINQTTISHQLKYLKSQNLISAKRNGKIIVYSLTNHKTNEVMLSAVNAI